MASLVAQLVKICLQCGRPGFDPGVGKIPWRRERLPTPVFWSGEFHGLCGPWGYKELDMTEMCGVGEDSRVPWTARRSNQSIIKEISPGCSLVGLMFKVKLQYLDHLM